MFQGGAAKYTSAIEGHERTRVNADLGIGRGLQVSKDEGGFFTPSRLLPEPTPTHGWGDWTWMIVFFFLYAAIVWFTFVGIDRAYSAIHGISGVLAPTTPWMHRIDATFVNVFFPLPLMVLAGLFSTIWLYRTKYNIQLGLGLAVIVLWGVFAGTIGVARVPQVDPAAARAHCAHVRLLPLAEVGACR